MRRAWMLCGLLALAGCDDVIFGASSDIAPEPPTVEGWAGVQQVISSSCLGCHSEASQLGGLDLESDPYTNMVGVVGQYGLPIVNPNDPSTSMFYLKIVDQQPENTGTDMPPGSGGLDLAVTTIVEDWINAGAPAE